MIRLAGGFLLILAVLLSCGWFLLKKPGSGNSGPAQAPAAELKRDRFAEDSPLVPFDATRAMGYLEALCKIGPRISGTAGMKKQQELLQKHFEDLGGKVAWQRFSARQRSQRDPVDMANLIVAWYPERHRRVILCSHYDTRPIADQEPERRHWREPFLSANDGGSGVALLMELAQHMKDLKTAVGVDFVLFDGEEYVFGEQDKYFFGSEHFADRYVQDRPDYRYVAAVLMDMIGGKDARFPVEENSLFLAEGLTGELWQIAAEQRCRAFQAQSGPRVNDDHLALNKRARIPAVDIIDFSYPHWHRLSDVPANCSADSLNQVARVLTTWLQRVK